MNTLEIRKSVNVVRSFVNGSDQTIDEQIALRAADYAQACEAINDRLARCADLLEKGHRPEALALAEQSPDILEAVSILNFPELDEWQVLCAQYNWTRPPALQLQTASAINDAYAKQSQLNGLLSQHRLLSLKRASTSDRLSVLRQIAAIDNVTAYWRDDIERFESARFGELLLMGARAEQSADTAATSRFLEEFRSEQWVSKVPDELNTRFAHLATAFDSTHLLPRLAMDVAEAAAGSDLAKLDRAANAWHNAVSRNVSLAKRWQPPEDLMRIAAPGLQYLADCKESQRQSDFLVDLRFLKRAMIELADTEKVDFLVAKAESHGYALPAEVQADLAAYRRGERRESALGIMLIIAVAAAALVVLVLAYLSFKLGTK
jgi:hypothetical protein